LEPGTANKVRPATLTALCVLSFLGSGLAFFTYTMVALSYEEFMVALREADLQMPQIDLILGASKGFFISGLFLYGASVIGVSLMWRMRKIGFHFYTMSQLLVAFHPWLFLDMGPFPVLSLLISIIFILLYGLHLKYMY
jgi:hypothetical protein